MEVLWPWPPLAHHIRYSNPIYPVHSQDATDVYHFAIFPVYYQVPWENLSLVSKPSEAIVCEDYVHAVFEYPSTPQSKG